MVAGHQQITRERWDKRRGSFHLVASQLVMQEAGAADEDAARVRLEESGRQYVSYSPRTAKPIAVGSQEAAKLRG